MLNCDSGAPPALQGGSVQARGQILEELWKDQMYLLSRVCHEPLGGLALSKGHLSAKAKVQPGMMTYVDGNTLCDLEQVSSPSGPRLPHH